MNKELLKPMKIFIADDSSGIRERLGNMISEIAGAEVIGCAKNGLEAIDGITHLNPDVVILDIQLPIRNGIEVLHSIRHRQITSKVIILTNYPFPQYRQRCIEEGADYFFDKSTEFEKVQTLLEQLS